ncbi:MAG: peptidylprolyl isomerase [Candidatus Altiarchaeota archaeon]|nr:peptidylprolyl isomerase [Candidatus Altiarchaeota archaeon]
MEVRASHILVGDENKARELKAKVDIGDDFATLAKAHSKCPSKAKGGDLGFFKRGRMVPAFDKFCFSNKQGATGVIKTEFGWHVIKVTGVKK